MALEKHMSLCVVVSFLVAAAAGPSALALIGEPIGAGSGNTFGITIKQGGTTLLTRTDLVVPPDIKINDSDPEDYIKLDDTGTKWPGSWIILKIVSDGGAQEPYRTMHWYVDSVAPGNIHAAGATSLFDPANTGAIDVEVTNLTFANTITAEPSWSWMNQTTYAQSFMRNEAGHFYEFADANPFVSDLWDVQVPGSKYQDGTTNPYQLSASITGNNVADWTWGNLVNPGTGTGLRGGAPTYTQYPPPSSGFVHEVGMAITFNGEVPEPGTLLLLAGGLLLAMRRR